MRLTDITFGTVLTLKIAIAMLLNHLCLLVFHYPEGSLSPEIGVLYANVHVGVAFLTMLLLGAAGAAASFFATLWQFVYSTHGNSSLEYFVFALLATGLQYSVLRVFLHMHGVSSTLRGLDLKHLVTLSCIFSMTYTLSMALMQDDLQNIVPTISQTALRNLLGIFSMVAVLKLISVLSKSLVVNRPRI